MNPPPPTPPDAPHHQAQPFVPIVTVDPVVAGDGFLRQIAHRALSVAVWVLVGRAVFAFWPRNFDFVFYLLPAAFVCLDVALAASFLSVWVARHRRTGDPEPRSLAWASLALLVPTVAWMLTSRLGGH
jgi:hypothetical protein